MANILPNLDGWDAVPANNQPDSLDPMTVVDDLRQIQATVKKYLASKGSNIASASTVDLSAATGSYVEITGTTTITSFGTVGAGIAKFLKFNSALQLTYNATSMILPTGKNINVEAGDTCFAVSLGGGNWQVVFYQRASGNAVTQDTIDTVSATATTTQLWNYSQIQNWTGTPTITDFPDSPVIGSTRYIFPAAGTQFINNANISIQGGAAYLSEAGDMVIVIARTVSTFDLFIYKKSGYATINYVKNFGYSAGGIVSHIATGLIKVEDISKQNYYNSTSNGTLTLPANSSVDLYKVFSITNIGAGLCAIACSGASLFYGKTGGTPTELLSTGDSISYVNDGANWIQHDAYKNVIRTSNVTPVDVSSGASYTQTHTLGRLPNIAILEYVCLTAEQGYSIGDVVQIVSQWNVTNQGAVGIWKSTTQVGIKCISGFLPVLTNKTTGAFFTPTAANWAYRFVVS